jgi:hypothetical protein
LFKQENNVVFKIVTESIVVETHTEVKLLIITDPLSDMAPAFPLFTD